MFETTPFVRDSPVCSLIFSGDRDGGGHRQRGQRGRPRPRRRGRAVARGRRGERLGQEPAHVRYHGAPRPERHGGRVGGARGRGDPRRGEAALNRVRSSRIAMVFQDPMTSLNPYMRIADQMTEVLTVHRGMSRRGALAASVRLLEAMEVPGAQGADRHVSARVLGRHAPAGADRDGAPRPSPPADRGRADHALDVTSQSRIMRLLAEARAEFGHRPHPGHPWTSASWRGAATRWRSSTAGRIMESGPVEGLFAAPRHPYTRGLLEAVPRSRPRRRAPAHRSR